MTYLKKKGRWTDAAEFYGLQSSQKKIFFAGGGHGKKKKIEENEMK